MSYYESMGAILAGPGSAQRRVATALRMHERFLATRPEREFEYPYVLRRETRPRDDVVRVYVIDEDGRYRWMDESDL